MKHLGDFDTAGTVYGKFTTYQPSSGAAFTLGGTPSLAVYKDGSATQSTAGVALTADFDSVTGLNHVAVDTSADGTFYSAGSHFEVVIAAGTVDSVSVVGAAVLSFSLRKDSALKPTTAGRSLDVSAGGEAGIDWANIGSPTTAVNLSATNFDVDQVVASVSGAVGSVTGLTASDVGAIKAKTDNLPSDPADESLIIAATDAIMSRLGAPAGASVSADVAAVKVDTAAVLLHTGTDGVVVAAASKTGYRLSTTGVDDVLRTALNEGYAADGAEFTLEQAMYMIWSLLAERSIASTTLTAKQLDGTTDAMTFTLDDATSPTSQTRAT